MPTVETFDKVKEITCELASYLKRQVRCKVNGKDVGIIHKLETPAGSEDFTKLETELEDIAIREKYSPPVKCELVREKSLNILKCRRIS